MSRADRAETPLAAWTRALQRTSAIHRDRDATLPLRIAELGQRFGASPALLSDDESLSYEELASRCNQYARWALGQGVSRGDVVCLMLRNCPDYAAFWLGVTRTGGIVALINTNLVGDSLRHAIGIVAPKVLVVD